ncbi:MAG: iron-containing alcohol dehydrogenase [Deltaproteobacteria bacterium]|jgi:alcohol dehydrogenase class IV|nr:iron-containing alcohol dehydrogenase [Deltaproteobacteria bacterium]
MSLSPYFQPTDGGDTVFSVESAKIKFGFGALAEIGADAGALKMTRVAVYTDANVAKLEPVSIVVAALKKQGMDVAVFEEAEIEPTDRSFKSGAAFAADGKFDGFVSVGGGSVMDTCKASNLYSSYPAEFGDFVNAPIGKARAVPGPLKPHIACPTTFGTAAESTGLAIFDYTEMRAKTGIVSPRIRPDLGILDPGCLETLPPLVRAANGFDVFSHACESFTARPFTRRPAPPDATQRPLSQGANPYSDIACLQAIKLVGQNLVPSLHASESSYDQALMFAGMLAGIGFGNAGNHLPHGMSYAVAGLVKDYQAQGWPLDHPMVPHGIAVILSSPAVFRMTAEACPDRYLAAVEAIDGNLKDIDEKKAGFVLADRIIDMMKATGVPNGLTGVGYTEEDLDDLTEKAFPQKRLIDNAPMPISREQLRDLFKSAMVYW